jgi:hypothetical protein
VSTIPLPPAPDAVLTTDDVAAWLQIKPRAVQRLGIPAIKMGHKTVRYRAATVLKWLDSKQRAL